LPAAKRGAPKHYRFRKRGARFLSALSAGTTAPGGAGETGWKTGKIDEGAAKKLRLTVKNGRYKIITIAHRGQPRYKGPECYFDTPFMCRGNIYIGLEQVQFLM
jgi:hypothetical protein